MSKSFFIDRHGCAKNQVDAELITGHLLESGYELSENAENADFIIVNSCGFIESAKKESIDAIYSIKNAYPEKKILLTGCLSERYSSLLEESMPEIDGIFGNGDLSKIADFAAKVLKGNRQVQTFPQKNVCSGSRPVLYNYKGSAFVKITEGCSNHCSFCAIPLIRGELRSRNAIEIIEEIQNLLQKGIYEINLIGQDLAAYGTGLYDNVFGDGKTELPKVEENFTTLSKSGLCRLLEMISKIQGDFIVRLLYIHPDHFNSDILPVIKNDSRFCKYFDIPFQSGDDKIIKMMNRKGNFQKYVELIKKIREELKDCTIRTTFLTGFPGETEESIENTKKFLKAIESDWSGCFSYSREENTPSYDFKNRVNSKIAKKRANELEEIQEKITLQKLQQKKGLETKVLIEEIIKNPEDSENYGEGLAIGRADFQAPEVDGLVVVRYDIDDKNQVSLVKEGSVVKVKILSVNGVDLDSVLIL